MQFRIECSQKYVWGPLVARDMSLFLISKHSVNFKIHLYKRRRKHRLVAVVVAVAAVMAAVAVVTAAARTGAWGAARRRHHRTPVFASTHIEVCLALFLGPFLEHCLFCLFCPCLEHCFCFLFLLTHFQNIVFYRICGGLVTIH